MWRLADTSTPCHRNQGTKDSGSFHLCPHHLLSPHLFLLSRQPERESPVGAAPSLHSLSREVAHITSTHIPLWSQLHAHTCLQGKLRNIVPSWADTSQLQQNLMGRKYWFWSTASYLYHTYKGYKPPIKHTYPSDYWHINRPQWE